LKNFFGTIDHKILENIIKEKIKDTKFMRYINRMFKAKVLSEGDLVMSDEGIVQGSCCSPVLANVFAHYAIDLWIEEWSNQTAKEKLDFSDKKIWKTFVAKLRGHINYYGVSHNIFIQSIILFS
jgi:retron-type reverse transcriptase